MTFRGALAYKGSNQTTANYTTQTVLTFDTEAYDSDGFHSTVTNTGRMTIPSGLGITRVRLFVNVHQELIASNEQASLQLFKNGSAMAAPAVVYKDSETGSARYDHMLSHVEDVTDGDFFEVKLLNNADTSVTIQAQHTAFAIEEVTDPQVTFDGALVTKSGDLGSGNYTTEQILAWDSEIYDTNSIHSNVTNNSRLSVPSGWSYARVCGQLRLSGFGATNSAVVYPVKNGTTTNGIAISLRSAGNSNDITIQFQTCPIAVVGGTDYFDMRFSTTDITTGAYAADSWFAIEKAG